MAGVFFVVDLVVLFLDLLAGFGFCLRFFPTPRPAVLVLLSFLPTAADLAAGRDLPALIAGSFALPLLGTFAAGLLPLATGLSGLPEVGLTLDRRRLVLEMDITSAGEEAFPSSLALLVDFSFTAVDFWVDFSRLTRVGGRLAGG